MIFSLPCIVIFTLILHGDLIILVRQILLLKNCWGFLRAFDSLRLIKEVEDLRVKFMFFPIFSLWVKERKRGMEDWMKVDVYL